MSRVARVAPLAFEDFALKAAHIVAPAAAVVAPESLFTQAHIDAAREAGRCAGRDEAFRDSAATHGARLDALIANLDEECVRHRRALGEDAARLRADIRTFLVTYCARLSAAHAAAPAIALVDRLIAASTDRAPATLLVSPETFAAFGDELRHALAARSAAFIDLAEDSALQGGACRLAWRGGAARLSAETIIAEVDRILAAPALEEHHE